ncbi:MAG TPA: 5'/3'-nucleotidase SurE [Thermoanaerobaculia bacterium]|nr:5'/3'-nucleotidase SurE [Thermoanaerobaculia bacterium]
MRVLLTNDDGYLAEGLRALARELAAWAEVWVVSPDRERSGSGRSITLHQPLRLTELVPPPGPGRWHLVNGTPTDCVNLALHYVLAESPPDLVVSGINHGLNLGDDVSYSGTVQAACEAQHFAVPAVALSQELGDRSMADTAEVASELLRALVEAGCPRRLLLNVNFPASPISGLRWTRLGRRVYRDVVVAKTDPRGHAYYWLGGKPQWDDDPGTDQQAVLNGFVSVTPLRTASTDVEALPPLERLLAESWGSLLR